jgi:hypothetical protein
MVQHSIKSLGMLALFTVCVGTLAGLARPSQPASEILPPGYSRDPATGALIATGPAGMRFESQTVKNAVVNATSTIPLRSISLDASGHIRAFEIHGRPSGLLPGTVIHCKSVIVAPDGSLLSINFASEGSAVSDSGCDMVLTIDGETIKYSLNKTTCTTACDVAIEKDASTDITAIFCRCRTSS